MATHATPTPTTPATDSGRAGGGAGGHDRATSAYRRAWWAIASYPIAFVAAFVIGEGLYTLLGGDDASPPWWAAPVAATPAIVVFVLPGLAAVLFGRRAMQLGRREGRTPAIIGAAIAASFVALNLLSYLAQLVAG